MNNYYITDSHDYEEAVHLLYYSHVSATKMALCGLVNRAYINLVLKTTVGAQVQKYDSLHAC